MINYKFRCQTLHFEIFWEKCLEILKDIFQFSKVCFCSDYQVTHTCHPYLSSILVTHTCHPCLSSLCFMADIVIHNFLMFFWKWLSTFSWNSSKALMEQDNKIPINFSSTDHYFLCIIGILFVLFWWFKSFYTNLFIQFTSQYQPLPVITIPPCTDFPLNPPSPSWKRRSPIQCVTNPPLLIPHHNKLLQDILSHWGQTRAAWWNRIYQEATDSGIEQLQL